MTAPVFISVVGYDRPCRLLTIGTERHATACGAAIPADEPVILTAKQPENLCSACKADMQAKRKRMPTIDLQPNAREIGVRAEVEVDGEELEFEK